MALERIILQHERKCIDDIQEDYNVLKNLVTLVRLEKQNVSPHLAQLLVTTTLTHCISKLLDIFGSYLRSEMRTVETSEIISTQPQDSDVTEKKVKRIKCTKNSTVIEDQHNAINDQIHILANLLNTLEIGGLDSALSMVDVIKLSQLTVKYFFWSLIEKSKCGISL